MKFPAASLRNRFFNSITYFFPDRGKGKKKIRNMVIDSKKNQKA